MQNESTASSARTWGLALLVALGVGGVGSAGACGGTVETLGSPDAGKPDSGDDAGPSCTADSACDDGEACTTNACVSGSCVTTPLPDGTSGPPPSGNPCTVSVCSGGTSFETAKPDSTACSLGGEDGLCAQGQCIAFDCGPSCDDGNACTTDGCPPGAGCAYTPLPSGSPCGLDGKASCDGNGACVACNDALKNGSETDVDCGGPQCMKCLVGQQCSAGSDCVSGSCAGSACQ